MNINLTIKLEQKFRTQNYTHILRQTKDFFIKIWLCLHKEFKTVSVFFQHAKFVFLFDIDLTYIYKIFQENNSKMQF